MTIDKLEHFYQDILAHVSRIRELFEVSRPNLPQEVDEALERLAQVLDRVSAPYNSLDDTQRAQSAHRAVQEAVSAMKRHIPQYSGETILDRYEERLDELLSPGIGLEEENGYLEAWNYLLTEDLPEEESEACFNLEDFVSSYANRLRAMLVTLDLSAAFDETYETLDKTLHYASLPFPLYNLEHAQTVHEELRDAMEDMDRHDLERLKPYLLPAERFFYRIVDEHFLDLAVSIQQDSSPPHSHGPHIGSSAAWCLPLIPLLQYFSEIF